MSYLKKLSQLHPHPSDVVTSLSSETKKTLASGGKQSPFRFLGAKPSPRSPFSQIWPPVDGESSQNRSKGHNRSHSNPTNYSTYPPQGLPITSPPSYGKTTGRSTPDRGMGGRATPDRNHNGGRATPDRSSGGRATPDRSSGGRATPDRSSGGRATPDRSSGGRATPDRSNNRARTPDRSGRSGTPDQQHRQGGQSTPPSQSRAFLIPRPSSGTGHRSGEGGSTRDRSNSGSTFASPRAMPPRSGTPGGTRTTPGGTPGQSPARDNHDNHDSRGRAGSVDQGSKEYYERKYAEEKMRNDQLQKKLQKLLSGGSPSDVSPVADRSGGGGSPRGSPKVSPSKGRRRAKSSDIGGDKSERGYIPPVEEQSSRPKLKLLSSRLSSSGQSIAQRFAQGPDETGGFLGGRGAGRGRGSPASTAVSS